MGSERPQEETFRKEGHSGSTKWDRKANNSVWRRLESILNKIDFSRVLDSENGLQEFEISKMKEHWLM